MSKLLTVIVLLFAFVLQGFSQLASWDLLINGNSTQNATNVIAGTFSGGTGISAVTYGSTGASASSWSTGALDLTNYFEVYIAPATGYNLTIQSLNFSERRSLTGIRTYEVQYATNAAFSSPITLTTVNVPDDDLERIGNITGLNIVVNDGDTLYFRWYGYTAEGSTGTWRINDATLKILGLVSQINPNNNDSYVQNPTIQLTAGNISSLDTSSVLSVPVFKVSVVDAGSGDGFPTKVTHITLRNSLPSNSANWVTTIKGVSVLNGLTAMNVQQVLINSNSISFDINSGDLNIPDGGSTELTFLIYLNSTNLVDGSQIQFFVDHLNHSWSSDMSGSAFLPTFASDVTSNIFTVDVQATKLQLTSVPQSVWANQNFSLSVKAIDVNNNIDLNSTLQVSVQKQIGSGILSSASGLIQILSNGVYVWNDLIYDTPGYFSVTVNEQTSTLPQVNSNLINCMATGQVLDDSFSDSDFLTNPIWFGETGDFIITPEYQLELFTTTASSADTSYLNTPVWLQLDSMEWQTYVDLNFSPSSSNYIKYYLMSNNLNLKDTLQGYFIKVGEDGANDAIELFYQNGTSVISVCRGTDGFMAVSPKVRIKVIRTNTGLWRIYADPTGGSSFELQTSAVDNSYFNNGFYTGIYCRYSSSYVTGKFYFDDFYCGPVQVDTVAPSFVSLSVLDSMHLDIHFSEGISLSTAQNISNFSVNNGIGFPATAIRDAVDYKVIHLTFSTSFVTGTTYTITAVNLADFSNNLISQPISQPFVWYKALPFDVQINEIMADPSPVVQLPDAEYIELFNRTVYNIDLTGWTLTIGSTTIVFPSSKILANDYLILTTSASASLFQSFGNVLGIIGSSSALVNNGNEIILKDKDNQVISYVQYSIDWYRSSSKDDGGWSLEQIDILNPCGEDANWKASTDPKGGTPGKKNAVYTSNLDMVNPELLRAVLTLPDTLLLTFSESMMFGDSLQLSDFSVNHGIGQPLSAVYTDLTRKKAILIFNQTFIKDTIYEVTVVGQLKDCRGNLITTSNKAPFAIPDTTYPGCFVINEILFNPFTGGVDYVELYNNSDKIFNLNEVYLIDADDSTRKVITEDGFYLFPENYVVLTTDYKKVTAFYSSPGKKIFVEMPEMPSYNTGEGRVIVANNSYQYIDDFSYNEGMQFQLLNDFKGVSLERIHPDLTTQDAKNWHSAAESAGFGTPGYKNSQYAQFDQNEGQITIEPEVFSPDMDGRDDVLNIRYKFDQPGFVANVNIFDARGRKIKMLIKSEMLGTEGYFTWDGLNDANQKASIGIYVIFIEVFNLEGKTSHYKKTCVLASHLD